MGEPALDIGEMIYNDLDKLARFAGLHDAEFGGTQLIQTGILPGNRKQQVLLYRKLIWNNIEEVESKVREALYVKLNLRHDYPNSGNQERLGVLARSLGRKVPDRGTEKGTNKQTEKDARRGQKYLAILIYEEIVQRNRDHDWAELLEDELIGASEASPVACDSESNDSLAATPPAHSARETAFPETLATAQAAHDSALDRPPRAEVSAIPLSPAVLRALEAARLSCETDNRQFVTIDVLLALLCLPGSKVAKAFDRVKPGQALEERDYLITCQDRTARDGRHPYLPVNAEARDEVWLARERMWRAGNRDEVNELHVLLGILENARSGTRRDLERRLGVIGYASLRQAAESLLEAADTTPSTFGSPDDDQL